MSRINLKSAAAVLLGLVVGLVGASWLASTVEYYATLRWCRTRAVCPAPLDPMIITNKCVCMQVPTEKSE